MDTILVSSGYYPETLSSLRRHWNVVDILSHSEALGYLQSSRQLPSAVVIGHAVYPRVSTTEEAMPAIFQQIVPAHIMLEHIRQLDRDLPVLISTAERRPAAIVDLVKQGAFDYVVEPRLPGDGPEALEQYNQELAMSLARAVQWRRTILENRQLKQSLMEQGLSMPILARSPAMLSVLQQVRKVAPTPATVLITGESGTGKELVARAMHSLSSRRNETFLAINCGALSESLLSSELFGHVKGAFTGADSDRAGLIRQAGEGSLFLDEVATLSPAMQVMLLRLLEQRTARPVGGLEWYPVKCRFIAAANRDLGQMVRQEKFREDLYYRLNVFHVDLPPLRDRVEDIPVLAQHFLGRLTEEFNRNISGFSPSAMELLERHSWPGNVRQLRNVIERAVILCEGQQITPADLGNELNTPAALMSTLDTRSYDEAMRRFESKLVAEAIRQSGGNIAETARKLQMKRTTLCYRIKQCGLDDRGS